jgi:hypothetical protein
MKNLPAVAILAILLTALVATAAEQPPAVNETFDVPLSKQWTKQVGSWKVEDGALKASQQAADEHVCAFRYRHPLQDADIQVDFKPAGARVFHVGFDPVPGELDKKGHLFAVVITNKKMIVQLNRDKKIENSKNEVLAAADIDLVQGKEYTLMLHLRGDQVEADLKPVDRREWVKVTARHPTFHVKKPGLVFRVGGDDGQQIQLDRVRVWDR